jgi:hypothetical protein
MKQCDDQWRAAKAAGTTNGRTWLQLLSRRRAALKTGAAAPSSASAPAPAAPPPTMHTVPAPLPTQTGVAPAPAPTGAGEFASEQQARAHCPSDTVVRLNTLTHVYHFPGTSTQGRSYYGTRKKGHTCARRMQSHQATVPRWTSIIRRRYLRPLDADGGSRSSTDWPCAAPARFRRELMDTTLVAVYVSPFRKAQVNEPERNSASTRAPAAAPHRSEPVTRACFQ